MYETEFLTAGLTIIGGIIIFIIGESINQFMIKPVVSLKEEIGRVAYCLVYYADIYANPNIKNDTLIREASKELRARASELSAKSNAVSKIVLRLICLPKEEDMRRASSNLLFLSNSLFTGEPKENVDRRKRIEELLEIKALK